VFSKAEFQDLLKQYQLVQLYTDKVPKKYVKDPDRQKGYAKENARFQKEAFPTQLPLYVILEPSSDGKTIRVVGQYEEGKINDEGGFAEFLKKPLGSQGGTANAQAVDKTSSY
jgi:hypothetical protein